MRVGSLFAGIGGIDLGLQRAGMEIVWQVEIDEWCRRVLARHFPDAVRYGDVRSCHGTGVHSWGTPELGKRGTGLAIPSAPAYSSYELLAHTATKRDKRQGQQEGLLVGTECCCQSGLAPVDLISGGFPCQPVSHAGRRLGAEDERWLWPEFLRIIREVRPRWALVENVPGLLSIDDGRLFGGMLRDLAEGGYDAEWDCIPAAILGAPHIRDRVFIVAHANGGGGGTEPGQQQEGVASKSDRSRTATLADAQHARSGEGWPWQAGWPQPKCGDGWWTTEPDVGRVAHGVPARVDRLRGLGNAVVPQVAEYIGRLIMAQEPRSAKDARSLLDQG